MKHYKKQVEIVNKLLSNFIETYFENEMVKEMVSHAIYGGKRLRSIIPLLICEKLNDKISVDKFSISIELFHTCSLIIDDMPCMDNDKTRRGLPTIHEKYGETKAQILVTLLLQKATQLLLENLQEIKDLNIYDNEKMELIFDNVYKSFTDNLGLLGASMGQYIDCGPGNLFIDNKELTNDYSSEKALLQLLHLKTTTFFEISFVGSYLICGGDIKNIVELKKAVRYFGLAFQLSDDFEDVEQDSAKNKDKLFNPNLVCRYGKEHIKKLYFESFEKFSSIINNLKLNHIIYTEIITYLNKRIK